MNDKHHRHQAAGNHAERVAEKDGTRDERVLDAVIANQEQRDVLKKPQDNSQNISHNWNIQKIDGKTKSRDH